MRARTWPHGGCWFGPIRPRWHFLVPATMTGFTSPISVSPPVAPGWPVLLPSTRGAEDGGTAGVDNLRGFVYLVQNSRDHHRRRRIPGGRTDNTNTGAGHRRTCGDGNPGNDSLIGCGLNEVAKLIRELPSTGCRQMVALLAVVQRDLLAADRRR